MPKSSLCLIKQAPRYEDVPESRSIAPPFLTLAVDGGEWSASRPCRFTTSTHCVEGWATQKNHVPAGNRTQVYQLVTRRYTDRAIPVL
jgi:hypothetical protein